MQDESEIQEGGSQTWAILTCEPLFWNSAFRMHNTLKRIVSLNFWTLKMWAQSLEFCSYIVYMLQHMYLRFWAAILVCWSSLALHNMGNSSTKFLNLKNVSMAVGIKQ